MFWRDRADRVWLFAVVTIITIIGSGYLMLGHNQRISIVDELLKKQLVLVKAGTADMDLFFQALGNSTAASAQHISIGHDTNLLVEDHLDLLINQWRKSGLVSGVVVTDEQGIITSNTDINGVSFVGQSLADKDYFVWAKNQSKKDDYFIGRADKNGLGEDGNQAILVVASPIFSNESFSGIVAVTVKVKPLVQYLEELRILDSTNIYLIDENGNFLYSTQGSKLLSDSIKGNILSNKEGTLHKDGQLVAYSPISVGSQNWLLVASSDESKYIPAIPFYVRQIVILVVASTITLILGLYISKNQNSPA